MGNCIQDYSSHDYSRDYSEKEAFTVFVAMIWEQYKAAHPEGTISPTRFAEITTEKWKSMTQHQKYAFFYVFQGDEERKVEQAKHYALNILWLL